jgi:5'-3' exonuclease
MSKPKKIAIIDGHYMMHRLGHDQKTAILRTKDGINTGIVYNTIRIINRIIKNDSPDQILFVMDKERSPRRKALLPTYKDRSPDPDIIHHEPDPVDEVNGKDYITIFNEQLNILYTLLQAMKVRVVRHKGEGDDVCWILATELSKLDHVESIIIFSDDHDYAQTLTIPKVLVDRPIAGERLDVAKAELKYDVPINLYSIYKSIVGDGSDKIPQIAYQFGGSSAIKLVRWLGESGVTSARHLVDLLSTDNSVEVLTCAGTPRVNLLTQKSVDNLIRNIKLIDLTYVSDEFLEEDVNKIMELASVPIVFDRGYVFNVFKELEFKSLTEVFVNPNFRRLL